MTQHAQYAKGKSSKLAGDMTCVRNQTVLRFFDLNNQARYNDVTVTNIRSFYAEGYPTKYGRFGEYVVVWLGGKFWDILCKA